MSSVVSRGSVFVCAFMLAATVAEAQVTRPDVMAPYLNTDQNPITIDGRDDDWGPEALAHGITYFKGDGHTGSVVSCGTTVLGTMTDRNDGEVTVYLAHDGHYLYVLAVIRDDLLEQRGSENNANEAWREDALQLYLDSTNARRANIPAPPIANQEGYEQFSVSTDYNCYTVNCDFTTNNTGGAAGPGAEPDQVDWLVNVGVTGSGPYTYVFEERIPLGELAGHNLRTMQPGLSYGFNAEFVDSDAGVYLQGWMFWSGDGLADPWNSQDKWGTMTLEAVPDSDGDGVLDHDDAFPNDASEVDDADSDGLGDNFEQGIVDYDAGDDFADIDSVLPGDDFDNDGVANRAEFVFHLNPADGTSHLPTLTAFGMVLCVLALVVLGGSRFAARRT